MDIMEWVFLHSSLCDPEDFSPLAAYRHGPRNGRGKGTLAVPTGPIFPNWAV